MPDAPLCGNISINHQDVSLYLLTARTSNVKILSKSSISEVKNRKGTETLQAVTKMCNRYVRTYQFHFTDHVGCRSLFFYHCPLALALWCKCIKNNAKKIDLVCEMELIHTC